MKTIEKKEIFNIFSKNKKISKEIPKINLKIIVDYREKNSLIPSILTRQGFSVEFENLKIGDYIVKNVCIERKTIPDFISSIISGRLVGQLENLMELEKKFIIIEGFDDFEMYSNQNRGLNPNAIRGFLLSTILKYKVPIIFSKNEEDSVNFMRILAQKKEKENPLNQKKKSLDKKKQLQFIIESFPGIGPKKSKKLLEKFGSIQNIINSPLESLKKILGTKAEAIIEIISRKY